MTKEATKKAPAKAKKDVEMLTLADVAREMGVDPKAARAAMRATGKSAGKDGRYPKVARGSDEHTKLCLFLEGGMDGVIPPKTK